MSIFDSEAKDELLSGADSC